MKPVLIIHGGAGSRAPTGARSAAISDSLRRIMESVYPKLARGGSALAAVTLAVSMLEDDPLFNAGLGSKIQSDGVIRMSASVMDGYRRRFSGCVNVLRVRNPVRLAERLLSEQDRVLEGRFAERYAKAAGLKFRSPYTPERRAAFKSAKRGKSGTVGAVAVDSKGRLAAATSTGGKGMEYPGRVSDSPTVAANFADRSCAVSVTGTGEEIVECGVAAGICTLITAGSPLITTARRYISLAKREDRSYGFIAVDRHGVSVAMTSTEHLIWAKHDSNGLLVHP